MFTPQHPASLNAYQQYKQACGILKSTSRSTNSAWYQEALDLDIQLHIRADPSQITAFYFSRKKGEWSQGPQLTEEIIADPSKLEALIGETITRTRKEGASSLGVILYIANEFATTELKSELNNPASLPDLRDLAVYDPASVIEDSTYTADQASWRVIPYPATGSEVMATAITITRKYDPLLAAFRSAGEQTNFPVITHALSAPLVTLMGLPDLVQLSPNKSFVALLHYESFTILGFFNEQADLCLIRTLQHQGQGLPERSRRGAIATTSAALELVDPDIFLVPLCKQEDLKMVTRMRSAFPASRVEVVKQTSNNTIPQSTPEPILAIGATEDKAEKLSNTFALFRNEKWALQNFLPTSREIAEIYPSRMEMRLLRILRLGRVALFLACILCLGYFGMGIASLMRKPEWNFNPAMAQTIKSKVAALTLESEKIAYWDNLLEDRSKVWITMEAFALMFPENGGMLVKTFSHTLKPETAPGQAKVGFIKEWKISGYARDEAQDYLNKLSTRDGINAYFKKVATATGNSAFNPTIGNRNITANGRILENSSFRPVAPEEMNITDTTTYPYTFELTITQRFESSDPLAINVSKAPTSGSNTSAKKEPTKKK